MSKKVKKEKWDESSMFLQVSETKGFLFRRLGVGIGKGRTKKSINK